MLHLFGATIFLSAGLLFLLQPMVAKALLPSLGGSPAVWNTCMVFFQFSLLAGYAYSHGLTRLRARTATTVHAVVTLIPLGVLGAYHLAPPWAPTTTGAPIPWLLGALLLMCGLPFFAVATTGPLLQRWFSLTSHPRARDPYFLYAASNAGSVLALLSYPLVEWVLTIRQQQTLWIGGYGGFVACTLICAGVVLRHPRAAPVSEEPQAPAPAPATRQKLSWVLLAAVPSSLVLGVTQYLSTDIAAFPLLWVLPLAIYLLTFVAAFSERVQISLPILSRVWAIAAVVLALCLLIAAQDPIVVVIGIHLGGLACAGLLCHRRLAVERPPSRHLTGFYLCIALGGALGGSFNALLGPLLFDRVVEYPIALVAVCFLRPYHLRDSDTRSFLPPRGRWLDVAVPLVTLVMFFAADEVLIALGLREGPIGRLICFGLPVLLVYLASARRIAFGLGMLVLLSWAQTRPGEVEQNRGILGRDVEVVRTFFGVHRINHSEEFVSILHGSTIHGLEHKARPGEPLLYYHPLSPVGNVMRRMRGNRDPRLGRVGLVGLGCGSMAAYAGPGERWTFFEIDPEVVRLARVHFNFLPRSEGEISIELGDGRLSLERTVEPGELGLLLLDAFSSDAIPTHLLTREALQLYMSRLRPDGLLLLHISNRYFDLAPIVASLAAERELTAVHWRDTAGYEDNDAKRLRAGEQASHWVLLARSPAHLPAGLPTRWSPLLAQPGTALWTDDYTNLLSVLGKEAE